MHQEEAKSRIVLNSILFKILVVHLLEYQTVHEKTPESVCTFVFIRRFPAERSDIWTLSHIGVVSSKSSQIYLLTLKRPRKILGQMTLYFCFLFFRECLTLHVNRLPSRRFTCNVKHYFLWKIWKTCFENVVCQSWLALKGLTGT